jgi:hypothetical protein
LLCTLATSVAAQPAQVQVTAAATASTEGASADAATNANATPQPKSGLSERDAWTLEHRRHASHDGSTGGRWLVDPSSGVAGSLRLQLSFDATPDNDFLQPEQDVSQTRQTLAVSWTALEMLELYGALHNRGTSIGGDDPQAIHSLGEASLGFKAFHRVHGPIHAGGDARFMLRNEVGSDTATFDATSVGLRATGALDMREAERPFPFIARINLGYVFDNSDAAVETVEAERLDNLTDARSDEDEDRHLLTRSERFAVGLNRVDRLTLGLGFEAPIRAADDMWLHPLVEWTWEIPVNRQGFDCPIDFSIENAGRPEDDIDDCLASAGSAAWPMTLSFGVRVVPPVRGISLAVALDLGLRGTKRFVHELAPNAPLALGLTLSYDYDARPQKPVIVERAVEPPPPPPSGHVLGTVLNATDNTPIGGAIARIEGADARAFATTDDGRFTSDERGPGVVTLEVSHPDYAAGTCSATIPNGGGDAQVACQLSPLPKHASIAGSVVDALGMPIANAEVRLAGPTPESVATAADGTFRLAELDPGAYRIRIESPEYLVRVVGRTLLASEEARLDAALVLRPPTPGVTVAGGLMRAPALRFARGSTQLDAAAALATAELADALHRQPAIARVRIQAGGSTPAVANARADELRRRLAANGIDATRAEVTADGSDDRVTIAVVP